MARRKQLKGVAGNLLQWCLSRNFDQEGYWAVGLLYAYAEKYAIDEFVIDLVAGFVPIETEGVEFSPAIKLLRGTLHRDLCSLNIPDSWVKDIQVIFNFNAEYQEKYHFWGSALGGKLAICLVKITTDHGKAYTKESGFNVWVHNPKRETRRSDY